jgi:hypothetical protein
MAPTARDLEMLREQNSARRWELVIRSIFWLILIAISAIPLQWVYYSIKELAGKDTKLSAGFTASMSVYGLAATVKAWTASRKVRLQQKEISQLRAAVLENRK